MTSKFKHAIVSVTVSLMTFGSQLWATTPTPPPPTTQFIQTAPFMNLQLNMATKAAVGEVVGVGQSVVQYDVTPRAGVRTLAASGARIGTFPPSVAAQTILFEVGLDDSKGYCAPMVEGQGVRQSQCFIDVNADNKFDASYITDDAWQGKTIYWGQVARLASIPPVPYENISILNIPAEPLSFYFKRNRQNMAEFQMGLGPRNNGVPVLKCGNDGVASCRLGRHIFVFKAEKSGLKVVSVNLAGDQIDIMTTR